MRANWIDAAGEQILLRLVAQAAIAERHEGRLFCTRPRFDKTGLTN